MRIHSLVVRSSVRPWAPWSVNLESIDHARSMVEKINSGGLDSGSRTYQARLFSWDAPEHAVGVGLIPSIPSNLFD